MYYLIINYDYKLNVFNSILIVMHMNEHINNILKYIYI